MKTAAIFWLLLFAACDGYEVLDPAPVPVEDAGCRPRHTLAELEALPCGDDRKVARCNEYDILNAAVCLPGGPGGNPLSDIDPGYFPSYGCVAPPEFNAGAGEEWEWWCCSKVFPGPLVCD